MAQGFTGWKEHNNFLEEHGRPGIALLSYFKTGHFFQATFENLESEFLQMAMFIIF